MKPEVLIPLSTLSTHYEVEMAFFTGLHDLNLIEIHLVEQAPYIHTDQLSEVERMIRLHMELNINLEGIDTIINLLEKNQRLEEELAEVKNKLRRYEDDL
ncbi:MAG: chaperone modulator CbpM [Marinoscillum sp.]|uniref:chaperone modulator CbpM n=1 Tax=Marinoscillum sp. TaxID=2024838 RepID=UPI003302E9BE